MKKETIKTKTESLFKEFLENNNYGIYSDSFMGIRYTIRKPKSSEKISLYYLEDLVSGSYTDLGSEEKFFDFIEYAFKKNKGDIALNQLIKKTPRVNSYDYSSFLTKVIQTLIPHNKELFEYVSRSKFLETSWGLIGDLAKHLTEEQTISLVEQTFTTKTFNNIETQKKLYAFVKNEIRDNEDLLKEFNKIKIIEETENVLDKASTPGAVLLEFNLQKLAGANIDSNLSIHQTVNNIETSLRDMADKNGVDLGLIDLTMKKSKFELDYKVIILCDKDKVELNKIVFEKLINTVVDFKEYKEYGLFSKEIETFYKECKTEYQFKDLNQNLIKNSISEKKNKI